VRREKKSQKNDAKISKRARENVKVSELVV